MSDKRKFLTVSGLTKAYGGLLALDDVSFEVEEGSTLALLGPSGCGKTTTLRCIAGLERPDAGSIILDSTTVVDVARNVDLKPERRGLGVVFQSYAIWPHMSVGANVGLPLKLRGLATSEIARRVDRTLDTVGLRQFADRSATQLSGGQQQRVALARALIHEPRLVLFDEALSNLDATLREKTRLDLKRLQERLGFTALYVTHDQTEAFALSERMLVMNRGRIEANGPPADIFHRPPTAFIAKFFGFNLVPGTIEHVSRGAASREAMLVLSSGGCLHGIVMSDRLKAGDRAIACVRRDKTVLSPAGQKGLPATLGEERTARFETTILTKSFLGGNYEYLLKIGDTEIRALQPGSDLRSGSPANLTIAVDDCFIVESTALE